MRKILYQQPHIYVRIIKLEELLQNIGVSGTPVDAGDSDAKSYDFDDDEDNFSGGIWED